MTLNKSAVLWIGTLTGGPVQGESPPVLVKESHIQTYSRTSVYLPTLPNFFGVVTLNTHFFYLALLNMRNTLKKKMAELTYAELTQDRESTRLPHTHKFTSLKNVVISALHKMDKRIHIQA